jgi:hypothetical protein
MNETKYPPYTAEEKAEIYNKLGVSIAKVMLLKILFWIGLIYISRKVAKSLEK